MEGSMKRFEMDEEIPAVVCEKYKYILGLTDFTTMYAHKALNNQLEVEEGLDGFSEHTFEIRSENEVSVATTRSD